MIARLAGALSATPRRRASVLAAALGAAALLALAPGGLAPAAARAGLAAVALAVVAVTLRRGRATPAAALAIVARAPLAAGAGLAVVEAGGRRLLVGFGRDGVRLVAELAVGGEEAP